jgi:phosphohistidine phosphatase
LTAPAPLRFIVRDHLSTRLYPTVKTLHLLRHAKSSRKQPELADQDRPLSKRGRRAADAMARRFAELGTLDLVLCSTALRTRQTLKRVSAGLKPEKIVLEPAIYSGGSRQLMTLLAQLPESAGAVLLIGHNPALHQLALALATARSARRLPSRDEKFPTAAHATFEFKGKWRDLQAGKAAVVAYVSPRDLDDEAKPA